LLGSLILKGYGDPTLSRADLGALARRIRSSGITRVTGRVFGDESYFDAVRTAPGWKGWYYRLECSPLSALMVDEGMLGSYTVYHPARVAAWQFRRALAAAGVRVARAARTGRAGPAAVPFARVWSAPLRRVVRTMQKQSDNVIAEMLLKKLGAAQRGRGSTAAGARVVRTVLSERGVPLAGVRIVDGSGLSAYDRLTPRAVVAILISAWSDARVARPFYRSLAVAGVDGTLEDRMRSGPAHRRIHAKTGTTDRASALSGYAGTRYVFSLLMNAKPLPLTSARAAQDRFAQRLAGAS
jgi:serine-type D-Ala-D-Ala carboxypeptidase/endopeptidase (penicillin-binding protein 4)